MKVIANINPSVLLVEISKEELTKMLGKFSVYSVESEDKQFFNVGKEFDFSQRLEYIREMEELPGLTNQLKTVFSKIQKSIESMESLGSQTQFEFKKRKIKK